MADPLTINAPLCPAEHVLAHAVTALVATRVADASQTALLHQAVTDAGRIAKARQHPQIAPLLDAARGLLTARPGTPEHVRADMQAAAAVRDFSMWRLGLALDRMQGR